ncbi:flocculation-associated PEP-CTERM protein PepA [Massilia sp. 9096]|uniref:flocculation-associated PEP-CTERM protein PepA n=1 Tax=Massilia sp. 9096 TaxID=1500894 RepID=UPI0005679766|nr:flocculation-associated PEP-CTERM protein PepA [Massilia sp. 9096]
MRAIIKTLVGTAITVAAMSAAHADSQLFNWNLNLPGGNAVTGINQLGFNGDSFIQNNGFGTGDNFTFTDNGIFNITTKNAGTSITSNGLGGGQLTGNYFGGTGTGSISSGQITFNAGGELDIYYNPTQTYDGAGATVANRDGATSGTLIARFTQVAGGGGAINPDGTPNSNGQLTLNFVSSYFAPGVFTDANGNALMSGYTIGFVTANASQDLGNASSATAREALSGSADTMNAPPAYFYVNNGGQLKLNTSTSAVPEPASLAIFGAGLMGLAFLRRRKS